MYHWTRVQGLCPYLRACHVLCRCKLCFYFGHRTFITNGEVPAWFSSSTLSLQLGKQNPFEAKKESLLKFSFRASLQSGTMHPGLGVLSALWGTPRAAHPLWAESHFLEGWQPQEQSAKAKMYSSCVFVLQEHKGCICCCVMQNMNSEGNFGLGGFLKVVLISLWRTYCAVNSC